MNELQASKAPAGHELPFTSDSFGASKLEGNVAMKRVFTAWRSLDGTQISLVPGDGPPRFANGELQPDCDVQLWRIEVGSYEEAMAIRNLRLSYASYVPQGASAPCPICEAAYYPAGA